MVKLWIAGASGAALEVWAVARALGDPGMPVAGFITLDGQAGFDSEGLPLPLEDEFLATARPDEDQVVLAIGDPAARARLERKFRTAGFRFPTLVHPSAIIGPRVAIGEGTVIMAGAVLETHLAVGRHCLINVQASIAHEGRIGDFCNLGPGVHLPGRVSVGNGCDLGTACTCRPGIEFGPGTVVGAGAVVVRNWPAGSVLAGVPARPVPNQPIPSTGTPG